MRAALTDFTPGSPATALICLRGRVTRMPLKADCICEWTLPPRCRICDLTRSWDFFSPARICAVLASESVPSVSASTTATGSPVSSTMTVTLESLSA